MKRALLLMLLAPVLLAPVRLKDSTPGFFEPPAQSPAPESYSLPAAEPLVTPTVIAVSPTLLMPTPTVVVSPSVVSGTLNLPLQPSPTAAVPQVIVVTQPAKDPNAMSEVQAALCLQGLDLVQNLAMLSYQQKPARNVMTLSLAASAAMGEVDSLQWPTMTAFRNAAGSLPLFQPQKAELKDGASAVLRLCVNPVASRRVDVPRPE